MKLLNICCTVWYDLFTSFVILGTADKHKNDGVMGQGNLTGEGDYIIEKEHEAWL